MQLIDLNETELLISSSEHHNNSCVGNSFGDWIFNVLESSDVLEKIIRNILAVSSGSIEST